MLFYRLKHVKLENIGLFGDDARSNNTVQHFANNLVEFQMVGFKRRNRHVVSATTRTMHKWISFIASTFPRLQKLHLLDTSRTLNSQFDHETNLLKASLERAVADLKYIEDYLVDFCFPASQVFAAMDRNDIRLNSLSLMLKDEDDSVVLESMVQRVFSATSTSSSKALVIQLKHPVVANVVAQDRTLLNLFISLQNLVCLSIDCGDTISRHSVVLLGDILQSLHAGRIGILYV